MSDFESQSRDFLRGRKVCATGQLFSLTRAELGDFVRSCGGEYFKSPVRFSMLIVVGNGGLPEKENGRAAGEAASGQSTNKTLEKARELQAYGYAMEFLSEAEFLERAGLTEAAGTIRGRHTLSDLSRVLGVSVVRLRRWVRDGLIEPVETRCQLWYFELQQVALARRITELLAAGTPLTTLRKNFDQLREWLPEEASPSQITLDGRLLVRRADRLHDTSGQRYFDFDDEEHSPTTAAFKLHRAARPETDIIAAKLNELFDMALQHEDDGRLDLAAACYRTALELAPHDPILHFNLGNVLYSQGQTRGAAECFRAALEHDRCYVEAWNNLGNCLAELRKWEPAEDALRQAIRLVPTYSDAHFNLADLLQRLGRADESEEHLQLYRRFSLPDRLTARRAEMLRIVQTEASEASS